MISKNYDKKIINADNNYKDAFLGGISHINSSPRTILDICTGTGFAAMLIAKYFKEAEIEAIDLSSEMIAIARSKAWGKGADNITFKIGNAMDLPYLAEKFDLVITTNAPIYLEEAERVLKQNGKMLISFSFRGEAFVNQRKTLMYCLKKME